MHRFGRHRGVSRSRARVRTRPVAALADAGLTWADMQFAFGGSDAAGRRRHAGLRPGPDRHPVHQRAQRLRHRRQRADRGRNGDPVRRSTTSASWSASTSTRAARSTPTPRDSGSAGWYGETGLMVTTQFFAHEDPALHARARHHRRDPGQGRGEGLPQRRAQPERLAAQAADASRRSPASPMVNDPLTQYMFCSPGEGARGPRPLPRRRRPGATPIAPVYLRRRASCARAASARSRCSARGSSPERADGPDRRGGAAPRSRPPASAPDDVDVAQIQDTESGAEIMHMAENGLCEHGEQEAADPPPAPPRSAARCRSTPTAAASPTASRSAPPACARSTRSSCSCAATPATRQVPGDPQVGFTHVYGAPGISACTVLTADEETNDHHELGIRDRPGVPARSWTGSSEFVARRDRAGRPGRRARLERPRPGAQRADPPAAGEGPGAQALGRATSARSSAAPATGSSSWRCSTRSSAAPTRARSCSAARRPTRATPRSWRTTAPTT